MKQEQKHSNIEGPVNNAKTRPLKYHGIRRRIMAFIKQPCVCGACPRHGRGEDGFYARMVMIRMENGII